MSRETVAKRLIDLPSTMRKHAKLYESKHALPLLYGGNAANYDLTAERARLSHHQANNEKLRELQNRGELVSAEEVLAAWQEKIGAARAKILSLPTKLTPLVALSTDQTEIESLLRGGLNDALAELAGSGLPPDVEKRLDSIRRGMDSTTGLDGKPMGGS